MLQGLCGGDALSGLIEKHSLEEVNSIGSELVEGWLRVVRLAFRLTRVGEFLLGQGIRRVGVGHHAGPVLRRRRAQESAYLQQLVEIVLPGEEWDAGDHLQDDAPDGPHINGRPIRGVAEQHIRRAIPQGDYLVRELRDGDTERPPEAEIRQLEDHLLALNQQVLRFEVSMEHRPGVAVRRASKELLNEATQDRRGHSVSVRVEELPQVHIEELKDERQLVLAVEHLVEVDEVGVAELHEGADLPDRRARNALLVVLEADPLEGHYLVGLSIARLVDNAVCALADAGDLCVHRGAHRVTAATCKDYF